MRGSIHLTMGVMAGCICCLSFGKTTSDMICIGSGCIIGSILPDIDTKASIISKRVPVGSFLMRLFSGHRGIIHTPINLLFLWGIYFFLFLIFKIPLFFMLFLSVGYLLHLVQDSFTKRGIMWLYPFSNRYYRILPFRSGKSILIEFLITLSIALCLFFACNFLQI